MTRQVTVTILVALATLVAISFLVFVGMQALPGNAASAALGRQATPEMVAVLSKQMGLDHPLLERYEKWATGLLHGDLGRSATGATVWSTISDRLRNTLALAAATLVFLIPISLFLGITAAVRRGGFIDNIVSGTSLIFIAIPEFVIGSLLAVIFAVWAGWLPAVSLVDSTKSVFLQPNILILPVVTLTLTAVAGTVRMVRACMIDVLRSDYIEMVRLKGLPERTVLLRHALPNALGPTFQILALNIAWLAGGVVIVETVFQYPGLGSQLTASVSARDIPVVEAIVMIVTGVYIAVNLAANLGVIALNPRLRRPR
jgi:peptide/nickel transport system permease protein